MHTCRNEKSLVGTNAEEEGIPSRVCNIVKSDY
jgi:hypothetical protein